MDPLQQHRATTPRDDLFDMSVVGQHGARRSTCEALDHLLLANHQHDLAILRPGTASSGLESLDFLPLGRQLRHHDIVTCPQVCLRHTDRQ